jgi:hypothetical protein
MRDYWMSKMFFDLQEPGLAAQFRTDREEFLKKYPLEESVKKAIRENDVPFLAARTNPYLLRYFFFTAGMKDDEFMRRLRDG